MRRPLIIEMTAANALTFLIALILWYSYFLDKKLNLELIHEPICLLGKINYLKQHNKQKVNKYGIK